MPYAQADLRDHILYSIWFGLALIALTIAIQYRLDSVISPMARAVGLSPVAGGSVSTGLAIACGVYLIFRLIRPFSFIATNAYPPQHFLYWAGTLIVTVSTALIAAFLGWSAVFTSMLRSYRIVGLVLPLAMAAGFLLIEAAAGRGKQEMPFWKPLYVDAGLLSALLVIPALLSWFIYSSQKSGLGKFVLGAMRDYSVMFVAFCVSAVIFFLWTVTGSFRSRRRRSRFYKAAVGALWIYGIVGFALVAVGMRYNYAHLRERMESSPGYMDALESFSYGQPLLFFGAVSFFWLVATIVLYSFHARGAAR